MGLNAGSAWFMSWEDNDKGPGFETLFYEAYPVMREIVEGGVGYLIMKLIGGSSANSDGQLERQGTYGNLKFRHAGLKDADKGPMRRWSTKASGKHSMKISVGEYLIDRRDNGGREYNIYIYPPGYVKNSSGEPWIGAYMTGVDGFTAERAIIFARDAIRNATSDQVVVSAIRSHGISKDTDAWLKSNPLLATRLGKTQDNLQPVFADVGDAEEGEEEMQEEIQQEEAEIRDASEIKTSEKKSLADMTLEDIRREIATRLKSLE